MKVVVLTGGVGGAKLVLGLSRIVAPDSLTAVVNTGDDFVHLGLPISPDIDTLLYTLAGKANASQGWGREGESWTFMAALRSLGGPDWFNLGDGDLALHILRLAGGSLSETTARAAAAWGVELSILPMSDEPVRTIVESDQGSLGFQNYFVEHRCRPAVRSVHFDNSESALPAPGVLRAIEQAEIILLAPSNPWLSIDPILSLPAIRRALLASRAPKVAVSPIIGGKAVKGPTAKIMAELGLPVTNASIAEHYADLLTGLLIDAGDDPAGLSVRVGRCPILMETLDDRVRVARQALEFACSLDR